MCSDKTTGADPDVRVRQLFPDALAVGEYVGMRDPTSCPPKGPAPPGLGGPDKKTSGAATPHAQKGGNKKHQL